MAESLPALDSALLEPLSRVLGDAANGQQLTRLLADVGLTDPLGERDTKWKRVHAAICEDRRRYQEANRTLVLVKAVLAPARFVGDMVRFEALREDANQLLAFAGYHLGKDGKLGRVKAATTLSEAQQRASRLKAQLVDRGVHPDVLRFCKQELVVENYFHAVFEATKSVADKIRSMSGLTGDGAELVDQAFGLGRTGLPILAFNSLQTETERSEQKGLLMLFKGMFGTFRNVTAHAPKITWDIDETDALDLLTLASFLHRRLDRSVRASSTAN